MATHSVSGRSGWAMVLVLFLVILEQGPTMLAVSSGGVVCIYFSLVFHISFLPPSLSGRRIDID